jgi:type IV fimbrial biogenesis protein FimT
MKINSHGFTITELLVVVVIFAFLLSMATLQFNSWQVKSGIETQTRELLADLSDARLGAIQTKGSRTAILSATSAAFRSYTTNEPVTLATGRLLFTKYFKHSIMKAQDNNGTFVSCGNIGFGSNVFTNYTGFASTQTIVVQPTGTSAAIDCLVVSTTKINLGKYKNGTGCVFQ